MQQGQLTEEDLKKMSPEEIRELQKKQCIFCHIISGRVASRKVYEDESVIAILDINPANPGHVLLMPKEHYAIMPQLPEEVIGHIFVVAKHISQALLRAIKVDGTYTFVANGVVAGQKAAHFIVHIIPRKEGDGLALDIPEHTIKEENLSKIKSAISTAIDRTIGGAPSEEGFEEEKIEPVKLEPEKKEKRFVEAEFEEEPGRPDLDAISSLIATKGVKEPKKQGRARGFVSSEKSGKFHALNCPFAKNIKAENRGYFESEEEAEEEGKMPCRCVN